MDIKDLAGLSQPLTKLVEVVSQGVGKLPRPYLIRKEADAKAYEIQTIADAIRNNLLSSGIIAYKNQQVLFNTGDEHTVKNQIEERILSRIVHQELKRQINIEEITQYAANQLKNEETVSNEKLDEDRVSRFFGITQDISSKELKMLSGRVLAGEVQRPKSYSLRTLELLKNLTKEDAEIFTRIGQFSLTSGDKFFIPKFGKNYLEEELGITFLDLLKLHELGLLSPTDLQYSLTPAKEDSNITFTNGKKLILVHRTKGTPEQAIAAIVYTTIGIELLSLLVVESNVGYLEKFARHWLREGVQAFIGDVANIEGGVIQRNNLTEITKEINE
jgi:hypothetical protein